MEWIVGAVIVKQGEINRKFFVLNDGNAQMLRADVAVGERVTGASVNMHSCLSLSLSLTHTHRCLSVSLSLSLSLTPLLSTRYDRVHWQHCHNSRHIIPFLPPCRTWLQKRCDSFNETTTEPLLSSILSIFVSLPVTLTLSLHLLFLPCFRDRFHIWWKSTGGWWDVAAHADRHHGHCLLHPDQVSWLSHSFPFFFSYLFISLSLSILQLVSPLFLSPCFLQWLLMHILAKCTALPIQLNR